MLYSPNILRKCLCWSKFWLNKSCHSSHPPTIYYFPGNINLLKVTKSPSLLRIWCSVWYEWKENHWVSKEEIRKYKKCWREDSCIDQETAHFLSKHGYKGKYSFCRKHIWLRPFQRRTLWPRVYGHLCNSLCKHCPKCFKYISSFNPHNIPIR